MSVSSQDQIYNKKFPLDAHGCKWGTKAMLCCTETKNKSINPELGFNLSRTFENHLKQLISQFSNTQSTHNGLPSKNEALWWAGPDSDRRPSARQADVLTRLDDRPTNDIFILFFLYRRFVFL